MLGLGIFRKRKNRKQAKQIPQEVQISRNQEIVFEAVAELGRPVTGKQVARFLSWDSASVTNRLAELEKIGRLSVPYRLKGADRRWRKFYTVASK